MNENQAMPKKIEEIQRTEEISVKEDELLVTENIISDIHWGPREFISYIRGIEKNIAEIDHVLSEEYKTKMLELKEKNENLLVKYKSHMKQADDMLRELSRKEHMNMFKEMLSAQAKADKPNLAYLAQAYTQFDDKSRAEIFETVGDKEKDLLVKCKCK